MNAVTLARLVAVRTRVREAARAELLQEQNMLSDIDGDIARATAVKNDIINEQRVLQTGTSASSDHESVEGRRIGAEHFRILQLNRRSEQEKRIISARARLLQCEREWERSRELLKAARDARDAAETRELEALPRTLRR